MSLLTEPHTGHNGCLCSKSVNRRGLRPQLYAGRRATTPETCAPPSDRPGRSPRTPPASPQILHCCRRIFIAYALYYPRLNWRRLLKFTNTLFVITRSFDWPDGVISAFTSPLNICFTLNALKGTYM